MSRRQLNLEHRGDEQARAVLGQVRRDGGSVSREAPCTLLHARLQLWPRHRPADAEPRPYFSQRHLVASSHLSLSALPSPRSSAAIQPPSSQLPPRLLQCHCGSRPCPPISQALPKTLYPWLVPGRSCASLASRYIESMRWHSRRSLALCRRAQMTMSILQVLPMLFLSLMYRVPAKLRPHALEARRLADDVGAVL